MRGFLSLVVLGLLLWLAFNMGHNAGRAAQREATFVAGVNFATASNFYWFGTCFQSAQWHWYCATSHSK